MKRLVNLLQPVVVKAVLASMVEHRIDVTGGVDATVAGYLESEAFDLVLIEIARASNQVKYAIVVGTTAGAADNQEVPLRPKAKLRFKNVGENNAASIGLIAVFLFVRCDHVGPRERGIGGQHDRKVGNGAFHELGLRVRGRGR